MAFCLPPVAALCRAAGTVSRGCGGPLHIHHSLACPGHLLGTMLGAVARTSQAMTVVWISFEGGWYYFSALCFVDEGSPA
jgi:hypothetical protein